MDLLLAYKVENEKSEMDFSLLLYLGNIQTNNNWKKLKLYFLFLAYKIRTESFNRLNSWIPLVIRALWDNTAFSSHT